MMIMMIMKMMTTMCDNDNDDDEFDDDDGNAFFVPSFLSRPNWHIYFDCTRFCINSVVLLYICAFGA